MTFRDTLGGRDSGAVLPHTHDSSDIEGEIVFGTMTVDKLIAGTITAQEIVIGGGAAGIIRSENYVAGTSGWAIFGDGSAEFNTVTVRGDIVSGNWDGADPANLATFDATATVGFYLDSSVGAAQFMGNIFVGGNVILDAGGSFLTAPVGTDRIALSNVGPALTFIDSADVDQAELAYLSGGSQLFLRTLAGTGQALHVVSDDILTLSSAAAGTDIESVGTVRFNAVVTGIQVKARTRNTTVTDHGTAARTVSVTVPIPANWDGYEVEIETTFDLQSVSANNRSLTLEPQFDSSAVAGQVWTQVIAVGNVTQQNHIVSGIGYFTGLSATGNRTASVVLTLNTTDSDVTTDDVVLIATAYRTA